MRLPVVTVEPGTLAGTLVRYLNTTGERRYLVYPRDFDGLCEWSTPVERIDVCLPPMAVCERACSVFDAHACVSWTDTSTRRCLWLDAICGGRFAPHETVLIEYDADMLSAVLKAAVIVGGDVRLAVSDPTLVYLVYFMGVYSLFRTRCTRDTAAHAFDGTVLPLLMYDSCGLVERFVSCVRGGLRDGIESVFGVLPLYVATYEIASVDALVCILPALLHQQLQNTRETERDILVIVRGVLSTRLIVLVARAVRYWVVLYRGDVYVWASQLRRFFVDDFERTHDASVDLAGEYTSSHFVWTMAYKYIGRLFRLMYTYHTAYAWCFPPLLDIEETRDAFSRLLGWLDGMQTTGAGEWMRLYLRASTVGVCGDMLQPHELRARMQRGIRYAMAVHHLQGPLAPFKQTSQAGVRGVVVIGILPKNKMCVALHGACAKVGHGTVGKLYFRAQTHASADATCIVVRSHSSKHANTVLATVVVPANPAQEICIRYS